MDMADIGMDVEGIGEGRHRDNGPRGRLTAFFMTASPSTGPEKQ